MATMLRFALRALSLGLSATLLVPLAAQTAPFAGHWEACALRSGLHTNPSPVEGVVWRDFVVASPGTPWVRLYFARATLPAGSFLRMVSLRDGDVMTMQQQHLEEWTYSSAYFNGNAVLVELVAGPNTAGNEVEIVKVMAGDPPTATQDPESICGANDSRAPSLDARVGRISPSGCTGWIINVPANGVDKCHLSAGHCAVAGQVLQFNVPGSAANCGLNHPPASRQFAIDLAGSRSANLGVGNDWWVFRCFRNPTTGLTTFQTQGQAFTLANAMPALNTTVRVTGYGLDGTDGNNAGGANASCRCTAANNTGRRNQTQQTDTGPVTGLPANAVNHQVDTCGGNSGSPVFLTSNGQAIAIHTHGGCGNPVAGTANSGTRITHANLQAAIAVVCDPQCRSDDCVAAVPLYVGLNGIFSNRGANQSPPAWTCGAGTIKDCWYVYTATCTGPVTFHTCTANRVLDTVMRIHQGQCGGPLLGCNDDACGLGSRLTVNLTQGQRYFIAVGGYNGAEGDYEISVEVGQGAGNIVPNQLGCGATAITVTGVPRIGGTLVTNVYHTSSHSSGGDPLPFIGLGFGPDRQFCGCTVFGNWQAQIFGSTHTLMVPCNASYIGVQVKIQGAFLNGIGGCSDPPVSFTNGVTVTIG